MAKFTYSRQNIDTFLTSSRNVARELSLERENCRLSERGSPERVKSWAIPEDSCLSESGLAWARKVAFRTCRGCEILA
ncbi:hypothetical protein Lal_00015588 [Lupinus albus]|nr:hypothetical protein Lal_00015588 [Lupinus albus]